MIRNKLELEIIKVKVSNWCASFELVKMSNWCVSFEFYGFIIINFFFKLKNNNYYVSLNIFSNYNFYWLLVVS